MDHSLTHSGLHVPRHDGPGPLLGGGQELNVVVAVGVVDVDIGAAGGYSQVSEALILHSELQEETSKTGAAKQS